MSIELLELAASTLGPLTNEVVFIGGATVHLWLTEPAAPPTRATDDVDVICDIASLSQYYKLSARLREREFTEAIDEPVICRWKHRKTGLVLDVMPTEESVLGFSNPWFNFAIETAVVRRLPSGSQIKAAAPPVIVTTKLAAWKDRGNNDLLTSIDLYDIIVLLDGRPELIEEIKAQKSVCSFITEELAVIQSDTYFDYLIESALYGYGQLATERSVIVKERLNRLLDNLEYPGI